MFFPALVVGLALMVASKRGKPQGAPLHLLDWIVIAWLVLWFAVFLVFEIRGWRIHRAEVQRGYTTNSRYQAFRRHDLFLLDWRTKQLVCGPFDNRR